VTDQQRAVRSAIAAASASVFFGASVVATRFVVSQTHPVSLAFLRYLIATLCLSPLLVQAFRVRMPRHDLLVIAGLGALFFGVFPWSFSASLQYSPSSRVAIEIATTPFITLIVSRLRGYDRITTPKVLGQLLAFVGLYLALSRGTPSGVDASQVWKGDLCIAITVTCGALYNVFSRPYLQRYRSLHITAVSMAAGMLFLAPIAAAQGLFSGVPSFTPGGWLAVLFLGVFGGAIGFALWIWALERSTPSRVAVFITLNPITAISLSALLLHEPITTGFLLGLIGVLGGIILANWRPATDR
jgi:drug/metabolite transporter (DMT)-like permease